MVTVAALRAMALSLPEAIEQPHFHLTSFRVKGRIFCTIHEKDNRIMVTLSPVDQSVFCRVDPAVIYPVPGGWGRKGSTFIELKKVRKGVLKDALITAYCSKAPLKLQALARTK